MKKFSLAILFMMAFSPLFAQSPFTFGPKVGVGYNTLQEIKNDKRLSARHTTSYSAGLFGRVNVGKFYVQPEIYYIQKGSDLSINKDNTASPASKGKVRLHAVDVPILAGYKLLSLKLVNLRVMAGPVATVMLSERKNDLKVLNPEHYKFNKSNVGFQAGIGIDVAKFTLDARYESGLNKINKNFNQRNSLFQLSLGLKLL